jgi:hypothetical protein
LDLWEENEAKYRRRQAHDLKDLKVAKAKAKAVEFHWP